MGGTNLTQLSPSITPDHTKYKAPLSNGSLLRAPWKTQNSSSPDILILPITPIYFTEPTLTPGWGPGHLESNVHSWHLQPSASHHNSLCRSWYLTDLVSILALQLINSDFTSLSFSVLNDKIEVTMPTSQHCWDSNVVMDLEHLAQNLVQAGIHSVGLLTHNFITGQLRNGLTSNPYLSTHSLTYSLIHLPCICWEPYDMQGFHWALVFVLEKPQLMQRQMRSLGRQRRPHPCLGYQGRLPGGDDPLVDYGQGRGGCSPLRDVLEI